MKRIKFLPLILLSIALFVLGQYMYGPVFEFFEANVDRVKFLITDQGGLFRSSLLFSLVLALIPVFIVLVWKTGHIVSVKGKVIVCLVVLAFISLGILIRHIAVNAYFKSITPKLLLLPNSQITYPINPVNFVYYMFIFLCMGCILSWFLFRRENQL